MHENCFCTVFVLGATIYVSSMFQSSVEAQTLNVWYISLRLAHFMVNVGKYAIRGSYEKETLRQKKNTEGFRPTSMAFASPSTRLTLPDPWQRWRDIFEDNLRRP